MTSLSLQYQMSSIAVTKPAIALIMVNSCFVFLQDLGFGPFL